MIVGIGVDVVDVDRFARTLERTPGLRPRLFADAEAGLPAQSLAGRFAAKEALAKALGAPPGLRWTDAVVTTTEHGRPEWAVTGTVARRCAQTGATDLHLSISHDGGLATAFVVAERREHP